MEKRTFQKAKLVTAVALASTMTFGMTGCILGGDESITSSAIGNNGVATTAPKGSIQGIVQDTNGNPIKGARVYVGQRAVTTNDGGAYQIDNVAVSGLTVTQYGEYLGGEIRVVIVPPAGFLGATVSVEPSAIIDQGRSDQGTSEEAGIASTNRFIDGFTAVAGDAVLPVIGENGATVQGVLRDEITGEGLANQAINLELMYVNGSTHDASSDEISYSSISFPATTDENGNFTINGAPTDADLNFIVGGYTVQDVETNAYGEQGVITNDEVDVIHVGNVFVKEIESDDVIKPFVTSIEEVVMDAGVAKLHDDVTNVLTVHFSERIQSEMIDGNSVVVRDVTVGEYLDVTVTKAEDARSITLTTASNLVAGNEINIYLLKVDFQDLAENLLAEDSEVLQEANGDPKDDIDYDYTSVNSNSDFLNLKVEVFYNLLQDAAVVSNLTQLKSDDSSQRLANGPDGISDAFADTDMQYEANGVQQLNSAENFDNAGANPTDSDERLTKLLVALQKAGQLEDDGSIELNDDGTPVTDSASIAFNGVVETNVARVRFTPSNASSYRYSIMRDGVAVTTNIEIDTISSPDAATVNKSSDYSSNADDAGYGLIATKEGSEFSDFAANDVAFLIEKVLPGDVISIQSMDDFGNEGSSTSVLLADNVPVTTGVQDAYEEMDLSSTSTVFGQQYGNGAELANPDAQALVGLPLLNVNAGMLAEQTNIVDSTPDLSDLYEANFADADNNNDAYIAAAGKIYDKTAYAAWSEDMSRTIAVSFTEDLAWTSANTTDATLTLDAPVDTATAALSNWTIMNDIAVASDSHVVNVDLASLNVSDIFTLANTDGQAAKMIDFTGKIQDVAGNVATAATNAKVVINDAMPPMVEMAVYNGSNLTITFNEAVMLNPTGTTTVVTLGGAVIAMDEDAKAAHNAKVADKHILVVPFSTDGVDGMTEVNRGGVFSLGEYNETGLASAASDAGDHASLDFSLVQDLFGNSWAMDKANMTIPTFAAYDNLGEIVASKPSPENLTDGAAAAVAFEITYRFTHAININAMLSQVFGTINKDTVITGAQVESIMDLTGATTIDTDNTTASISDDGTELTINLRTAAALSVGDSLDFTSNVPSLWTNETVNVLSVNVPTP